MLQGLVLKLALSIAFCGYFIFALREDKSTIFYIKAVQ